MAWFCHSQVKRSVMLTVMQELPPHVFGVKAQGEVTREDLEQVLLPGLDRLVQEYDAIHYLLVLETSVGEFTAGAWLQDLKAGLQHLSKWKKIAVVTEQRGVRLFTDLFRFVTPGVAKGFAEDQLPEAVAWVSETEQD